MRCIKNDYSEKKKKKGTEDTSHTTIEALKFLKHNGKFRAVAVVVLTP